MMHRKKQASELLALMQKHPQKKEHYTLFLSPLKLSLENYHSLQITDILLLDNLEVLLVKEEMVYARGTLKRENHQLLFSVDTIEQTPLFIEKQKSHQYLYPSLGTIQTHKPQQKMYIAIPQTLLDEPISLFTQEHQHAKATFVKIKKHIGLQIGEII